MLGDKFDDFIPSLVEVINLSILSMLDNIMHRKVQCVHQTPTKRCNDALT